MFIMPSLAERFGGKTDIMSVCQYVHYAVVSLSEIDSQLAEIDENLMRNELNALERGEQFARRKELYEAKYPQVKRGGDKQTPKAKKLMAESAVSSFTEDTAAKTNIAARTIRKDVQIANRIPETVRDTIRDSFPTQTARNLAGRETKGNQPHFCERGK